MKIQDQCNTEKRGASYVRRFVEPLARIQAKVYWVRSGHMIADGLTELSNKSPVPNLDLLNSVLAHGAIYITYCAESWREEIAAKKGGTLYELEFIDTRGWKPPEENEYDTLSGSMFRKRSEQQKSV